MLKKIGKKRIVAIILAVVILSGSAMAVVGTTIILPRWQAEAQQAAGQYETTDSDRKMAEDLSDMTGVSVYKLLEMRSAGKDWDEIMQLSADAGSTDISDKELEQLIAPFPEEDVDYASQLASRVIFNIREINAKNIDDITPKMPNPADLTSPAKEEYGFQSLEGSFGKNMAVYLMLALKESFGSMELVLDEYLYCLQIDVDLRLRISDKDAYDKKIAEKSAVLMRNKAITMAIIEEKMLESLNGGKKDKSDAPDTNAQDMPNANSAETEVNNMPELPAVPTPGTNMPAVSDPRPKAPSADVYDEIDRINQGIMPY